MLMSVHSRPFRIVSVSILFAFFNQIIPVYAFSEPQTTTEEKVSQTSRENALNMADASGSKASETRTRKKKRPAAEHTMRLSSFGGPAGLSDYVLFATHSMHLKENSIVVSGHVGVNAAGEGPFLDSQVELAVGESADTPAGYAVKANRIKVKQGSHVYGDIDYNELVNNGTIHGTLHTPLSLPLFSTLPDFHEAAPGSQNITLAQNEVYELLPGSYKTVTCRKNSKLIFTGGTYNLEAIVGGTNIDLLFRGPSEVRISGKFDTDENSFIGPEDTTAMGASEIAFYVAGINGNNGNLSATPKAAQIGLRNLCMAHFYVPNGTLWIREHSDAFGQFIAKDLILGIGATAAKAGESQPANTAPVVNAGPDRTIDYAQIITLNGIVTDDGLPEGGTLSKVWRLIAGPGMAAFEDSTSLNTQVQFGAAGVFTLRLIANDDELESSDDILITVQPPPDNQPPAVHAGPDQILGLSWTTVLTGTVTDDGLPVSGLLQARWTMTSGPGHAGFGDMRSDTTQVTFSRSGVYVLRLTADDGALTAFDEITVTVYTENMPPVVFAGNDTSVTAFELLLHGKITDDGLPEGASITALWSKVNGPGEVDFQSPAYPFTTVRFGENGTYVLRLTANDSEEAGHDDIAVTVSGNRPPCADAGEDQTVMLAAAFDGSGIDPMPQPEAEDGWVYEIGRPGLNIGFSSSYRGVSTNGLALHDGKLYASGIFDHSGSTVTGNIAVWNKCSWSALDDPRPRIPGDPNSPAMGVPVITPQWRAHTAAFQDHILLYSDAYNPQMSYPPDAYHEAVIGWDGYGWSSILDKNKKLDNGKTFYSSSQSLWIQSASDAAYIGGDISFFIVDSLLEGTKDPRFERSYGIGKWDGENWKMLGNGILDVTQDSASSYTAGLVKTIACGPSGDVYTGGQFVMDTPSGQAVNIARWNGSAWEPVGQGVTNPANPDQAIVDVLFTDTDGTLYIGGEFTRAGGVSAKNIAKCVYTPGTGNWEYTPFGSGLNGAVLALTMHRGVLYAGGEAFSTSFNYVTAWKNNQWSPLVSPNGVKGVNGKVQSLVSDGNIVYIGGQFLQAGGEPSSFIVGWGMNQKKTITGLPDSVMVENSPQGGTDVTLYAQVSQACGGALTATWHVDGGPAEYTETIDTTDTSVPLEIQFTKF